MIRERLGTGLAVVALGTLVLVMVLTAGWFGVGWPGGLFGPAPSSGGARVVLVAPGLTPPGSADAPGSPATPDEPPDAPAPPADVVPAPPVPAPPLPPGTPPSPDPPAPPPAPVISGGVATVAGDTVGSLVTLTASTVEAVGSTLGDVVQVAAGLLTSPADDAPVTAAAVPSAESAESSEASRPRDLAPPAAAATPGAANPEGSPRRGRGLPTTPRIPDLPR